MLDKYKRLFNSAKILLKDYCSRLQIDIIKANKSLCYLYRPLLKGTFNNKDVAEVEAKEVTIQIASFNKYKAVVAEVLKKLAIYNKEGNKAEAKADRQVSAAGGRPLVEQLANLEGDNITSKVEEASKDSGKGNNKD